MPGVAEPCLHGGVDFLARNFAGAIAAAQRVEFLARPFNAALQQQPMGGKNAKAEKRDTVCYGINQIFVRAISASKI